ncbi:MAG TPA: cytochrome c oxidase subunit 3, partial [Isosphaeraceae bacterium]|nr:cytochrome c oxidase subunit 3 [Isosphaeraceae bacterium]
GNFRLPEEDAERMIALLPGGSGPQVTGQFRMFFVLYFFMTGLHAIHLIIGLGIWGVIAYLVWKNRENGAYVNKVEVAGLYWHFIDIVWVYLYPLLYLVDPHIK